MNRLEALKAELLQERDAATHRILQINADLAARKREWLVHGKESPMGIRACLEAEREALVLRRNEVQQELRRVKREAHERQATLLENLLRLLRERGQEALIEEARAMSPASPLVEPAP